MSFTSFISTVVLIGEMHFVNWAYWMTLPDAQVFPSVFSPLCSSDLPSSFKGAFGKIVYTLEANLSRPMRADRKAKAKFNLLHEGRSASSLVVLANHTQTHLLSNTYPMCSRPTCYRYLGNTECYDWEEDEAVYLWNCCNARKCWPDKCPARYINESVT